MALKIAHGDGFIAALDQSGGSSPKALSAYGIGPETYSSGEEMFTLIHAMRCRVLNSPSFNSDSILGAILFEQTMNGGDGRGGPFVAALRAKGIVPFLKVDQGLEDMREGVQLMKPMTRLSKLCERARSLGVFGTKMRAVIHQANEAGIERIVRQQIDCGIQILEHGLVPILEPEVSLACPERSKAERILLELAEREIARLPADRKIIWKLTIPEQDEFYDQLAQSEKVMRVLALSGGYTRDEACKKLSHQSQMIASFSRALLEGLEVNMSAEAFDRAIGESIEQIKQASFSPA
ncbi:fructose bisphosphate aldolase [Qipengyuania aurantiaca]|uniref:fructose-bisphosphate aldolase n=2 Tax=Qipengyuania aurantiaca TaxID=2867233 RepID=A0ABX8ZQ66_9SPHN|nr:fructose bisphosphate aldolase [Qipengyuania aurantiaca]QZD91155.1 fructose bisphosphate aldolase [Qipengyuania aurantiaca]